MLVEYGPLPECSLAERTNKGFFVRVDAQVLRQVGLLAEPFATLDGRATVRPGIGVDPLVLQQCALLLKVLPAGQTLEQSQVRALRSFVSTIRTGVPVVNLVPVQQIRHSVLFKRVSLLHSAGHSRQNAGLVQIMM